MRVDRTHEDFRGEPVGETHHACFKNDCKPAGATWQACLKAFAPKTKAVPARSAPITLDRLMGGPCNTPPTQGMIY